MARSTRDVLLLDETLAQAWQPATGYRGTALPTGLGWFVQSYSGQRVVWHFGNVPNAYSSLIIKLPERNLTFILLANSDRLASPLPASCRGRQPVPVRDALPQAGHVSDGR